MIALAVEKFHMLPRELMQRATSGDIAEILAHYELEAKERRQKEIDRQVKESGRAGAGGTKKRLGKR